MAEEDPNLDAPADPPADTPADPSVDSPADAPDDSLKASDDDPAPKTLLSDDESKGDGEGDAELSWQPPDGVELQPEHTAQLESFKVMAKDMGLTQDQFQQLLDFDIKRGADSVQQMTTAYEERVDSWADAVRADTELGGDSMPEILSVAKQARDALATDELKSLLEFPTAENPNGLALGNHPEVIRLFYRIGQAIGDHRFVIGGDAVTQDAPEKRMFPTMNQ